MFREKAKEEKMKEERNKLPESKVPADIRWDIMYTMRQIMLLIAILIFVTVALVAPSSAATNANIVITEVTPTDLSPGDIKEVTLIVKNQGGGDARHITMNFGRPPYHHEFSEQRSHLPYRFIHRLHLFAQRMVLKRDSNHD
jgi:hypothetical protein